MGRPRKDKSITNNLMQKYKYEIPNVVGRPDIRLESNQEGIEQMKIEIKAEASSEPRIQFNQQQLTVQNPYSCLQREKGDSMFDQTGLFEKGGEEWVFLRSLLDDNQATLFPSEENIEKFNKAVNPIQKKPIFKVNKGHQNTEKILLPKESQQKPKLVNSEALYLQSCFNDHLIQQRFLNMQFEHQVQQDKSLNNKDFIIQWQPFENLISNVVYGIPILVRKNTLQIFKKPEA